jgi:FkbM family methyltransferase
MSQNQEDEFRKTITKWFDDNGDHDHLRNYELKSEDLIVDVGAYKGKWLVDMYNKYGCRGIGFEPVRSFIEDLVLPENIKIYNFAIGSENKEIKINLDGDGSSISNEGEETIIIKDAKDFIKGKKIEVLMINIEGYEYELVPYLIKNKCLDLVQNIQIQFHRTEGIKKEYMSGIIEDLNKLGFSTKFHYEFVWWGGSRNK